MRHVFLDTDVFYTEGLYFSSKRLTRLAELVRAGEVKLYVTDVVVGEVRRAITDRVKAAVSAVQTKEIRGATSILAQSADPVVAGISAKKDVAAITTEIHGRFEAYLDDLDVETISTDEVSAAELRRRYFEVIAPFGYRAEKKHEFPDAMNVLALDAWTLRNNLHVLVVSADQGLQNACKSTAFLIPVGPLEALISTVVEEQQATMAWTAAANQAFTDLRSEVTRQIAREFESSGFMLEDENGEVESVEVTEVRIDRVYLFEINEEFARFELHTEIDFDATVSYDDPEMSVRDSETGEMFVFETIEDSISRTESVTVWVEIDLNLAVPGESAVEQVILDTPDTIFVTVNDWANYH